MPVVDHFKIRIWHALIFISEATMKTKHFFKHPLHIGLVLLALLFSADARAQLVSDGTTVTINGTSTRNRAIATTAETEVQQLIL